LSVVLVGLLLQRVNIAAVVDSSVVLTRLSRGVWYIETAQARITKYSPMNE